MTASDLGVVWPPPVPSPTSAQLGDRRHVHRPAHPTRSAAAASVPSGSQMLVLFPIRVFLAVGWARAGVEKFIDPEWWKGDTLRSFLTTHRAQALPPFRPVLDHLVGPTAVVVAFVVMATEIACGIALGVGRPLRAAVRWGVVLNVLFILSGPVNPSAFYLVMEMVLLLAIAEGTIGRTPTPSTTRTLAAVAGLLVSAGVLVPYVRTLQPAKVIADPAIMLVFLAVVQTVVLSIRHFFATGASRASGAGAMWASRINSFICARPARGDSRARPSNRRRVPDVAVALGWRRTR